MSKVEYNHLAEQIARTSETGESIEEELATSGRIIARVTDGIYREPWAAFRELIANAYDADATQVLVETGQPDFEQVTFRDNGIGMTPAVLAYVMKNIGGSSKRTAVGRNLHTTDPVNLEMSEGGRPLIGKIGIGLFAVAQLTQHFQIITKQAGSRYRLSATVRLRTYDEHVAASDVDPDAEYVAGKVNFLSESVSDDEVQAQGTRIILYDLREQVKKDLRSERRWEQIRQQDEDAGGRSLAERPIYHIGSPFEVDATGEEITPELPWAAGASPEKKFHDLIEAASEGAERSSNPSSLAHFDAYLQLLWKLSLSLPLEYAHGHPFDLKGDSNIRFLTPTKKAGEEISLNAEETLRSYFKLIAGEEIKIRPFEVFLDGIKLQRPIVLQETLRKSNRVGSPVMLVGAKRNVFGDVDAARSGGALSFEGYLYWNSKVVPKDTAGVLVRIRDASGTLFDQTFMGYQVSEQTRLRQITAEIFVHEGLDSAINIDRESFNYSHPHFVYIQSWLHRALRLLVNRLKNLAKSDLVVEKERLRKARCQERDEFARKVWAAMNDDDLPEMLPLQQSPVPGDTSFIQLNWDSISTSDLKPVSDDEETAAALTVVLEAYGVLSNLSSTMRARLLRDIMDLFSKSNFN